MVLGTAVAGLTCLADVTSANIVGYQGNTLVAGKYNMIAIPFSGVANETQKLTEVMSGKNWFGGEYSTDGDNLLTWDPIKDYTTYYYYVADPDHPGEGEYDGWYDMDGMNYFDDCEENQDGLEAGWCAWYLSRGSKVPEVTMAGAVPSEDDIQFTIQEGRYNLIVNPFPTAFQPNSDLDRWEGKKMVDWGKITGGEYSTDGDNILIWDPIKDYTTYYYYAADPATPGAGEYDGWYDMDGMNYFEDIEGNENGIPAGKVFWYLSRAAKGGTHKITFFSPIK